MSSAWACRKRWKRCCPDSTRKYYPRMVERYRYHYLSQDQELVLFDGVPRDAGRPGAAGLFPGSGHRQEPRRARTARSTRPGLLSVFDATRCADETFSKPHPAMLHELTRELGQDMKRTVMIGDTTHDLQMALNAGAGGIAVALRRPYAAGTAARWRRCMPPTRSPQLHAWLNEHA